MDVRMTLNGRECSLSVEPRVTLLDALRDRLHLTGTKKGCDQGACGACTVLANGRRITSCLTLAVMHDGDEIVTIEGLRADGQLHPLQRAFVKHDGFQCGYCTPGQIVSAAGLLKERHDLTRESVREEMSGNICRCASVSEHRRRGSRGRRARASCVTPRTSALRISVRRSGCCRAGRMRCASPAEQLSST